MISDRVIDFNAADAVPMMLDELRPYIRRLAVLFGYELDGEFAQDLEQEAAIQLWQMDPTRFDAGDMPYIRGVLYKHMHTIARDECHLTGGGRRVD